MYRKSLGEKIFDIINTLGMLILALIMIFPFYYIFIYSISNSQLVGSRLIFWPVGINFNAYRIVFDDVRIIRSIVISVLRVVTGPAMMIFVSAMAGYALTRNDLGGVKFLRKFFVFTMYMGAGIIPTYLLIKNLGLISSFWVYIIPQAVSVYNMILIKTYIESIPKGLEEAARIDGANDLKVFWRIIFPACTPIIAAVGLFSAVGHWNDFVDTQFYNNMNPELFTLQYYLYQILSSAESLAQAKSEIGKTVLPQSLKMAVTMITILPIALVYPFVQKYFAKGLLIGAVKG